MNENNKTATPEIPLGSPIVKLGKRTCALYERSWTDNGGAVHKSITLAEVVPSDVKESHGQLVVAGWTRKFKGVNIGLETRDDWIHFIDELQRAFPRGLSANGAKPAVARIRG